MTTIKIGQLSFIFCIVCTKCAIGQDNATFRQDTSPNTIQASPNKSTRSNSVDDYLGSLPPLTANGQLSFDAKKNGLIPGRNSISTDDSKVVPKEMKAMCWMTPSVCYGKTYFNDDQLERHGKTRGFFQPAYSISRLLIQTSVFPAKRTLHLGRSTECVELQRFASTNLD